MSKTFKAGSNSCHLLEFCIGNNDEVHLAINVLKVAHVLNPYILEKLPSENPLLVGYVNWHNKFVPAISMKNILKLDARESNEKTAIIVQMLGHYFALLVSQANQIYYLTWQDVFPSLSQNTNLKSINYISSIAQVDGQKILPLFDFEQFLLDNVLELSPGENQPLANILIGKRVLYAEDSPLVRSRVVQLLTSAGAQVYAASNGKEALEKYHGEMQKNADLVISDIEMPVMDGFTLIRRLRESPELNCPIGIFTSLSHQQLISQAEGLGVDFVVTKYDDNMLAKEVLKVFTLSPQSVLSNGP